MDFPLRVVAVKPWGDNKLVQPTGARGFRDVCGFIVALAEAGIIVECTAVKRPEVDINATRKLALALGATTFRERSFHL